MVTEEDDDDEDAAPPVIAPRPDHTKSVSDRLMTCNCLTFEHIGLCLTCSQNIRKASSLKYCTVERPESCLSEPVFWS